MKTVINRNVNTKMLRRIFFLGLLLLLCITNISFCYEYLSNDEPSSNQVNRKIRVDGRKSRRKFNRRNQAHIDVASFIQRPDVSSLDENQPFEQYRQKIRSQSIDYGNYGAYANLNDEINKDNREYQSLNVEKIPEVNILHAKHFVPQHNIMNLNGISMDEVNSPNIEAHKIGTLKQFDFPYNTNTEHFSRKEKKCAGLKKIKIPFFSRDKNKEKDKKPETTEKKGKKRRLFRSRKVKKSSTSMPKTTVRSTNSIMVKSSEAHLDADKIYKRSYFEKLCPACKQMFFGNSKSEERRKTSHDMVHNSRQYFERKTHDLEVKENDKPNNFDRKPNSFESNNEFESSMMDRRWKRDLETVKKKPNESIRGNKKESIGVSTQDQ